METINYSFDLSPVAVLFSDKNGIYAKAQGVDVYDKERGAENYSGDFPVVAHPPCQLWGNLAFVNYSRWGGNHNKPGNDGGLFEFALETVRRCGGVLEHPAYSKAFKQYRIPYPVQMGWQRSIDGGWICEVWQSAYGHPCNKATWLYYQGKNAPLDMDWRRVIGTHQIGGADSRGKDKNKPTLSGRKASATPVKFRDALLALARHSGGPDL